MWMSPHRLKATQGGRATPFRVGRLQCPIYGCCANPRNRSIWPLDQSGQTEGCLAWTCRRRRRECCNVQLTWGTCGSGGCHYYARARISKAQRMRRMLLKSQHQLWYHNNYGLRNESAQIDHMWPTVIWILLLIPLILISFHIHPRRDKCPTWDLCLWKDACKLSS